jgi:hypothetical protein
MESAAKLELKELEQRIVALERFVFGDAESGARPNGGSHTKAASRGPTEGLRDLILEGFFRMKKRTLREVRDAMGERGFLYSAQAIDVALTRNARRDGALVLLREGGRKIYAERR